MVDITAPVGRRGDLPQHIEINRSVDVCTVKALINHHAQSIGLTSVLPVTGTCDQATIEAIEAFQRQVVGLRSPDGRVDPGGRTITALNAPPGSAATQGNRRVVDAQTALRRGVILAPAHNSPTRRADATGAFQPGAWQFQRLHGLPEPILFNNLAVPSERRRAVLDAIYSASGPLDVIAYFGHGLVNGLSSAGFDQTNIGDLATAISSCCRDGAAIVLYACSAGTYGGFAETLSNAINIGPLRNERCRIVYGHTCSGHSFYNPYVTFFPERAYVVEPGTLDFPNWRYALRSTNLWARFPFLDDAALRREIEN